MKNIVILLLSCLGVTGLSAQSSIKGKIVDEKQKPLKGASILLLQQKDSSLVLSAISDADGVYTFNDVKNGTYRVLINMLGYKKPVIQLP